MIWHLTRIKIRNSLKISVRFNQIESMMMKMIYCKKSMKLLKNKRIKKRIPRTKQNRLNQLFESLNGIFVVYVFITF